MTIGYTTGVYDLFHIGRGLGEGDAPEGLPVP